MQKFSRKNFFHPKNAKFHETIFPFRWKGGEVKELEDWKTSGREGIQELPQHIKWEVVGFVAQNVAGIFESSQFFIVSWVSEPVKNRHLSAWLKTSLFFLFLTRCTACFWPDVLLVWKVLSRHVLILHRGLC